MINFLRLEQAMIYMCLLFLLKYKALNTLDAIFHVAQHCSSGLCIEHSEIHGVNRKQFDICIHT